MAMSDCVQSSCDFLLQSVRNSGLNFFCQETPFSIFLTVRKSFVRSVQFQPSGNNFNSVNNRFEKNHELIEENKSLKEAFYKLKVDYEHAIGECESNQNEIEDLKEKLVILNEKLFVEQNNNVRINDIKVNRKLAEDEVKLENVLQ